jgi:hypothetical protein
MVPCFEEYKTEVKTVCHDKTLIQGATDLLQQPELCE